MTGARPFIAQAYSGGDLSATWGPYGTVAVGETVYTGNTPAMRIWSISLCRGDLQNDWEVTFDDLNPFLEARGIEVVDTDLGERIVQLAKEPPSHIVIPAIHWKREEIGALFHRTMGTPAGETSPDALAAAARVHLRDALMNAGAGITGANAIVAETGGVVVCTNEGNADLGMHSAPIHIACVGIEKIVATRDDLGVLLRLLARSGTGQSVTAYTTHVASPRPGAAMHVVLVDNGRTTRLADEAMRTALHCIRCGACLNTCPVYRRSGGYSYGHVIQGPIGAILAPAAVRQGACPTTRYCIGMTPRRRTPIGR